MSIKRFDESCIEGGGVAPHENGEYVKYADHIAIQQRLTVAEQLLSEALCHAQRMEPISASLFNRIDSVISASLKPVEEGEGS